MVSMKIVTICCRASFCNYEFIILEQVKTPDSNQKLPRGFVSKDPWLFWTKLLVKLAANKLSKQMMVQYIGYREGEIAVGPSKIHSRNIMLKYAFKVQTTK
jgi:hypothetical protein